MNDHDRTIKMPAPEVIQKQASKALQTLDKAFHRTCPNPTIAGSSLQPGPADPESRVWMSPGQYVAKRLRIIFAIWGVTRRKVAQRSGIPYAHLCRILKGKPNTHLGTLKRIAHALGLTWDQLFTPNLNSPLPEHERSGKGHQEGAGHE